MRSQHSQEVNANALCCPRLWGRLAFGALLILLFSSSLFAAVPDVRVLIDISGSMKQNDPNNLRAPALRLLVGLMPDGTRSGVWTFGQYVNMQVPLGKVDKAWKARAMKEASKISSHGLYTNIDSAVVKATPDWDKPDPAYQRHLILLTDGMVDVSKDPRLDAESRRHLLEKVLPRLEAADVTIHTIALSKNADKELLSELSGATKGAFVQVDDAKQLQRVFLKLFEKSVEPDALPIEDNKFSVDKHVNDFTVLVFLAKDSPHTLLNTPDGTKWSQQQHPDAVSWHHEPGYDLITVKSPKAGEWRLQAKVDPDNRVMVVTNLRLKVDKIPNTLLLGDDFNVQARLLEDGKTASNQKLLSKTHFQLTQKQGDNTVSKYELEDNGTTPDALKGDGVYSVHVPAQDKSGEFEMLISASSTTFKREVHQSVHVYASPADYAVTQPSPQQPFQLSVKPHAGLIRPESISMQVSLPDDESQILKQVGDLEWQATIPAKYVGQGMKITIVGKRYNDENLKMTFEQELSVTEKPQALTLKPKETVSVPKAEPAVVEHAKPVEEKKNEHTVDESTKKAGEQKAKKRFNWTVVIIMVVVINLVIILLGWFAYKLWRKRQNKEIEEIEAGVKE